MDNIKSRLNIENGIEITSVGSFLEEINNLREKDEDFSLKYFFRGQRVEFWDISSSIFRAGMLNSEHQLLKEPLEKFPNEFKSLNNTFDLMTKCQHYGLCTRLLDLTTNPLVALYFACQKYGIEHYEKDPDIEYDNDDPYEKMEPWGVIFYKKDYPVYSDDKKVKIITELAKYNLQHENSLNDILKKLQRNNIINNKDAEDWFGEKHEDFIKIIQSTYIVQPTYNNTRLIAQSGAFLLPGMFSFKKNNFTDSVITKCKGSLRKEFEDSFFYICGENKKRILEELNICNINESTLFPELEHQLKHIKNINKQEDFDAPNFEKYENTNTESSVLEIIETEDINPNFESELRNYIQSKLDNNEYVEFIKNVIMDNISIDWYKKESILSQMQNRIIKQFIPKIPFNSAKILASDIVKNAVYLYKIKGE